MSQATNPDAAGMNVDPTTVLGGGGTIGRQLLVTAVAIVLGLLVGALLIVVSGVIGAAKTFDPTLPITAYGAVLEGALGGPKAIANTLNAATPLIFAGLSVSFGFRAGLFNIGANGQFLVGAFCAAIVGTAVALPFPLALALAILAGGIGGAAWGFIPGALKAWRGAHEVVVTIMLNSVAYLSLNLLASSVFKDPTATFPRTSDISAGAVLPIILENTRLHGGIILAVVSAVLVWFLLFKTTTGFEIRTVGASASAARYAGIRPAFITILTMSISGGLAGIGGSVEILGITKNYPAEYLVNFGFDGIAVALLGRAHPFGVVGSALLFGVMRAGAGSMQRATEIPVDIISIIQGVILLFVAAQVIIQRLLPAARARRRREPAAAAA
ncbi:MAG TPA: ABC transporter permease [Methylomirabilota bacterium]|nr:ABC transporter permease [Methylomirabilota bacterium]